MLKKTLNYIRWSLNDRRFRKKSRKIDFYKNILNENKNISSIIIEKDRFVLNTLVGSKFEWEPDQRLSCLGLAHNSNYETLELKILKEFLHGVNHVFDIGANFGFFTISLKMNNPETVIYSFEPITSTFKLLQKNLILNTISSDNSYNIGFSDSNGQNTFYLPEKLGSAWVSMGKGVNEIFNQKLIEIVCEVRTIDSFVNEHSIGKLDLIKADVEGAELMVIKGGIETIKKYKTTLMLEIGDRWTASFGYNRVSFIDYLIKEFDFLCFGVLNEYVIEIDFAEKVSNYSEDFMYNYFFVHRDRMDLVDKIRQFKRLN